MIDSKSQAVETRDCRYCGEPFERSGRKVYCSPQCSRAYWRTEGVERPQLQCGVCGATYAGDKVRPSHCSDGCRAKSLGLYRVGWSESPRLTPVEVARIAYDAPDVEALASIRATATVVIAYGVRRCKYCRAWFYAKDLRADKSATGVAIVCAPCNYSKTKEWYGRPENAGKSATYTKKSRTSNPERARLNRHRDRAAFYGLSVEQLDALYEAQAGACGMCGEPESPGGRRLAIDHDHACCPGSKICGKCVRGLLCSDCNIALGYYESPKMEAARAYLEAERKGENPHGPG